MRFHISVLACIMVAVACAIFILPTALLFHDWVHDAQQRAAKRAVRAFQGAFTAVLEGELQATLNSLAMVKSALVSLNATTFSNPRAGPRRRESELRFANTLFAVSATVGTVETMIPPRAMLSYLTDRTAGIAVFPSFRWIGAYRVDKQEGATTCLNFSLRRFHANSNVSFVNFLHTVSVSKKSSGSVFSSAIEVTPATGTLALSAFCNTTIRRDVFGALTPQPTAASPLQLKLQFAISTFAKVLSFIKPPTTHTSVFVVYAGLLFAELGRNGTVLHTVITIPVTLPLRTPEGYNCFIDITTLRFASCVQLVDSVPLLGEYLATVYRGPGTYYFDSNVASSSKLLRGDAIDIGLDIHVIVPLADVDAGTWNIRCAYIVTALIAVVATVISTAVAYALFAKLTKFCREISSAVSLDRIEPTPRQSLSILREVRTAEVLVLRVAKRLIDASLARVRMLESQAAVEALSSAGDNASSVDPSVVPTTSTNGAQHTTGGGGGGGGVVSRAVYSSRTQWTLLFLRIVALGASSPAVAGTRSGVASRSPGSSLQETRKPKAATPVDSTEANVNAAPSLEPNSLPAWFRLLDDLFKLVQPVFRAHTAFLEFVEVDTVVVSFRSSRHALRAVECARNLAAVLDSAGDVGAVFPQRAAFFIACDSGHCARESLPILSMGHVGGAIANETTGLSSSRTSSTRGILWRLSLHRSTAARSTPATTTTSPSSFLATDVIPKLARISALQETTLRSRIIFSGEVVCELPRRIQDTLMLVDVCVSSHYTTGGVRQVRKVLLYEDPTGCRTVRTTFSREKEMRLSQAVEELSQGKTSEALSHLEDLRAGNTETDDVVVGHVERLLAYLRYCGSNNSSAAAARANPQQPLFGSEI